MKFLLCLVSAAFAYLIAGWNPAITFSRAVFHRDIRGCGSGNPGFTNFKRTFGGKWAWIVLALDLLKGAAVSMFAAFLFGKFFGCGQFGAALTCLFGVVGHAFPVWYRFKGGKGFLVCLSSIWVVEPAVGAIAAGLMIILLLLTKYMSFSTVVSLLTCPVLLALWQAPPEVVVLCAAAVLLVAVRHRENFKRLRAGTESRFYVKTH